MNEKSPKLMEDEPKTMSSPNLTLVNMEDNDDDEIDLLELFYRILDKWHYLLLCCLAGAVLLNAYAYFMIHPTYETTAKLYIVSASKDSVVDLTDLNIGTSLSEDYVELIQTRPIYEDVIKELNLDYDYEDLRNMVAISGITDTRILTISVTSPDKQEATDIANALANQAQKTLPKLMDTPKPSIAEKAIVPEKKSSPSYKKNIAVGALGCTCILGLILTVLFLMDDTIKSAEDIEKEFGIMPMTVIPEADLGVLSEKHDKSHMKNKKKTAKKKAKA